METIAHLFSLPLSGNVAVFALMLAVILIIPLITHKLHIPQVIGLILCGVIIGPHTLNLVDNTGGIGLFSTIGVLYILFTAGLELDINQFKMTRGHSILFGLLTSVIPMALVMPLCHWWFGMSLIESAVVSTMFGVHTLIAYPAVSRMGVTNDPAAAVTVGATIIADAGVLILMTILLGMAQGELSLAFWIHLTIALGVFFFLVFAIIPRLCSWFFSHWHNEKYLRYVFVMMIVFICALLAEMADMEPIIGAFLAGLVLNRYIPRTSSLMHHIEFVGNALFIPFFLVTVGMLVDVSGIVNRPSIVILTVVLSIIALAGKWLASLIAQKLFHYTPTQRRLMFGLSGARVASTLAIALVVYHAGIIDEFFLNAIIILILITSIAGSFMTEKAARQLAIETENAAENSQDKANGKMSGKDERILMPIANPSHAGNMLSFADLIRAPESPHRITLLSVVRDDQYAEASIRSIRHALNSSLQKSGHASRMRIAAAIDPDVSEAIARSAREQLSTIILLGWPKYGLTEKIIGETWRAVVHDCEKLILWLDLPMPFTTAKRIVLMSLPNAAHASGIQEWLSKIVFLAEQTSLPIIHYGSQAMADTVQSYLTANKKNVPFSSGSGDPFDLCEGSPEIHEDDWLVFASARPGTMCYDSRCRTIPLHLSAVYPSLNKILIYPHDWCTDKQSQTD